MSCLISSSPAAHHIHLRLMSDPPSALWGVRWETCCMFEGTKTEKAVFSLTYNL